MNNTWRELNEMKDNTTLPQPPHHLPSSDHSHDKHNGQWNARQWNQRRRISLRILLSLRVTQWMKERIWTQNIIIYNSTYEKLRETIGPNEVEVKYVLPFHFDELMLTKDTWKYIYRTNQSTASRVLLHLGFFSRYQPCLTCN